MRSVGLSDWPPFDDRTWLRRSSCRVKLWCSELWAYVWRGGLRPHCACRGRSLSRVYLDAMGCTRGPAERLLRWLVARTARTPPPPKLPMSIYGAPTPGAVQNDGVMYALQ